MRAVNKYATRTALTEWAGQSYVNKVDGVSLDPRLESFGANTRLAIDVLRQGVYLTTIYAYATAVIRNADTGRGINVGSIVYGETSGPLAFWSGNAWIVDAFTVTAAVRTAVSALASDAVTTDGLWAITDAVSRAGSNVLDVTGATAGAIKADGTIDATLSTWLTTVMLPCDGLTPLYFSKTVTSSALYGIVFYDATGARIGAYLGPIPANTPIYPPRKTTQFRFAAPATLIVDMTVTVGRTARLPTQEAAEADKLLRQAYDGPNATLYNSVDAVAAGGLIVGGLNVANETVVNGLTTWRITPYVPVIGSKISFSAAVPTSSSYGISFYDRNKVKIGNLIGLITAGQVVTLPAGTRFFRFSHPVALAVVVSDAETRSAALPLAAQWIGKRVINLGDSISARYNWMGDVCAALGMVQVLNAARSGRVMEKALYRADDTTALVQADFTNVDLCFMLLGTNNVSGVLGSMSDAVGAATFYGQTRQVIETVYGWNPETRFVISTLLWRSAFLPEVEALCAAIKEIAAFYAIPVCDLRSLSGFSSITMASEMSDGLHPDTVGYRRRLIPAVRGVLRNLDPIAAA